MLGQEDLRTNPNLVARNTREVKLLENLRPGGRMSHVFQLLATAYAVGMLVVSVHVYTTHKEHPGMALFFVACTASFYIICYNALVFEDTFRLWLEQHHPALRNFSFAAAMVLTAIPAGILFLMPRVDLSNSSSSRTAKVLAETSNPANAPGIQAPNPGPTSQIRVLKDIRYWAGATSTTVSIDLDDDIRYEINRLTGPDRIYLDMPGSKLDPALAGRRIQVENSLLRAIRVAEHEAHWTRVTLETKSFCAYSVTPIPNSHRLLIELWNWPGQS
jgi:hypothetical protein